MNILWLLAGVVAYVWVVIIIARFRALNRLRRGE